MNQNLAQNFQYVMPADEDEDYADDDHLDDGNEMEDDEAIPDGAVHNAKDSADDESDEANEENTQPAQQILNDPSRQHQKMSGSSHQKAMQENAYHVGQGQT